MTATDFWSRRKADVAAEEEAEARTLARAEAAEREAALAEKPDEEILAELGLPDPDSLAAGDDFKVFLSETVPARIRTRALRRLWRLNPVLANVDGLVDYGEDFTDASTVVESLQTAYQVGKGMLKHVEELARQADSSEAQPDDTAPSETTADDAPEPAAPAEPLVAAVARHEDPAPVYPADDPEPTFTAPRRMRFAFDDPGATL